MEFTLQTIKYIKKIMKQ
uniref:Uncharacterized protein n=1 Tax=Anguilla anguilla TaxID=7936 RepID=A0A0E9QAJ7_ANGAN